MARLGLRMTGVTFGAVALLVAACSTGPSDLSVGECVDVIGLEQDSASERLITVDCDTDDTAGIYRVLWIEEAANAELATLTDLAMACAGPTLLPDADMLAADDRTVVCFEPLG